MNPAPLFPVLVRPCYLGNVGAVVRVTANFGGPEVRLVGVQVSVEEPEFLRMAMGAEKRVRLAAFPSLPAATAGCTLVLGFTSLRERDPRGVFRLEHVPSLLAGVSHPVALVFGAERGGLSREEMRQCTHLVTIPTDPSFPVLNLAQAVAITLAFLSMAHFTPPAPRHPLDQPAPADQVLQALQHLHQALLRCGFLDPQNPRRVGDQVQRLLSRASPTAREVGILHALAAHLEYLAGQSGARVKRESFTFPEST